METPIEVGSNVVAERDGELVAGEVTKIAKGWITIQTGEAEIKARAKTVQVVEDEDGEDEELSVAQLMSRKLAEAKKNYVRDGKTYHCGDAVATALNGEDVHGVARIAEAVLEDFTAVELLAKYEHLNPGQQRMNIGNRIRRAVKENPELVSLLPGQNAE